MPEIKIPQGQSPVCQKVANVVVKQVHLLLQDLLGIIILTLKVQCVAQANS